MFSFGKKESKLRWQLAISVQSSYLFESRMFWCNFLTNYCYQVTFKLSHPFARQCFNHWLLGCVAQGGDKTEIFEFVLALGWKSCLPTSQVLSQNFNLIEKVFELPIIAYFFITFSVVFTFIIEIINNTRYFQTLRQMKFINTHYFERCCKTRGHQHNHKKKNKKMINNFLSNNGNLEIFFD